MSSPARFGCHAHVASACSQHRCIVVLHMCALGPLFDLICALHTGAAQHPQSACAAHVPRGAQEHQAQPGEGPPGPCEDSEAQPWQQRRQRLRAWVWGAHRLHGGHPAHAVHPQEPCARPCSCNTGVQAINGTPRTLAFVLLCLCMAQAQGLSQHAAG